MAHLDGFNFFERDPHHVDPHAGKPWRLANTQVTKIVGGLPQYLSLSELLKDPDLVKLIGDPESGHNGQFLYWRSQHSWYIYVDAPPNKAKQVANKIRLNLKGLRNLNSSQVSLHGKDLYVGSNDGEIQKL